MAYSQEFYSNINVLHARRLGNAGQQGEYPAGLMVRDLVNGVQKIATREPLSSEKIRSHTITSLTNLIDTSYASNVSKKDKERMWQKAAVEAGVSSTTVHLLGQALSRMSDPQSMEGVRLLDTVDTFMEKSFGGLSAQQETIDPSRLEKAYDVMQAAALFLLHNPSAGATEAESYKYNPQKRFARAQEKLAGLHIPEQFTGDPLEAVVAAIVRDPGFFEDTLAQQVVKMSEKIKGKIGGVRRDQQATRNSWQDSYARLHSHDTVTQGQEVTVVPPEPVQRDIQITTPALRREQVLPEVAIKHEVPALIGLFGQFLQTTPEIRSRLVAEGKSLLDRPEYRVMKGLLPDDENTYLALALQALQETGKAYLELSPEWKIGFHSRSTSDGNTIGQAQILHIEPQGDGNPSVVTRVHASADITPDGYLVQNGRATLSADVYEQGAKAPNLPEVNNQAAVEVWVETLAQLERAFTPPPALPEGNN